MKSERIKIAKPTKCTVPNNGFKGSLASSLKLPPLAPLIKSFLNFITLYISIIRSDIVQIDMPISQCFSPDLITPNGIKPEIINNKKILSRNKLNSITYETRIVTHTV